VHRSVMLWCAAGLVPWLGSPLRGQTVPPTVRGGASAAMVSDGGDGSAGDGTRTNRSQPPPLERRVTLDLRNVTLRDALREIDRQARLGLAFTPRVVPLDRRVTIRGDSVTVGDALERVLRGTGVKAVVTTSETVMLVKETGARSETAPADTTGYAAVVVHVADDSAKPIIGAVVGATGTKIRFTTTEQGYALLRRVPSGLRVITARYVGYTPVERQILVPDTGFVRVDFVMRMGTARLQEVVTTATGTQRRYELANDITILNADSIVATQPISNVTDLLEGRVPGLTVQHTSGAPGDPSRIRLRGTSSVLRSNDPIVIVDGIRVYAAQSDSQSANIASLHDVNTGGGVTPGVSAFAAPSPLDQIDPHSIATIEVLKGPSAATLYGPDAANGVIVITTKRGKAGPASWSGSASHGLSSIPGKYQDGLYRWGHDYLGQTVLCPLTDFRCQADSLVRFQALNHPRYTFLKQGASTNLSLGVSGGSEALTYAFTGSREDATGPVGLPDLEAARFRSVHDGAAPLAWMRRPEQLGGWSGESRLTAKLNDRADVSLFTLLTRQTQQRSDLEQQIPTLMTTYIDRKTGTIWSPAGGGGSIVPSSVLLPSFYQRATDAATNFTGGANFTWRPLRWLTTSADAGLNLVERQDELLLPHGMLPFSDSVGHVTIGHGSDAVSTVNLRATGTLPLPWGFRLQLATGANYINTSMATLSAGAVGLPPGSNSLVGAERIVFATQTASDIPNYGWYVEPTFTHQRFSISTGVRIDGSSAFGTRAQLPTFPKLGGSWLVSEEPWFPFKKLVDVFRARAAYGQAGVWPGPADKLRLYSNSWPWLDGGVQNATQVLKIGNSQLRPERSAEIEAGFDADLLHDRVSIGFSGYQKMRYDAIMPVPVAPSVYGSGVTQLQNIGVIRNTGLEASLTTQLLRTDPVAWSVSLNVTRNHNLVTKLGRGVLPFGPNDARVVAGYPLFGRWARPILAYTDANHDGIIERNEVLLGDSLVFMGASEPDYEANLFTSLSLLRGAVTVSASFSYQAGLTQVNRTIGPGAGGSGPIFSPGASDPHAPFSEQAAVAVMNESDYGLMQTVNTLRFTTLAVAYNIPTAIAHWLTRARALSVALQGTNLGLFTNYKGKDPNVNAFATGNQVVDTGVLPLPRYWLLSVHTTY